MLLQDATALITEFGETLTIRQVTSGTYDPATGSASNTNNDVTFTGMFLNFNDDQIDGSEIRRGDRKVLLSATTPPVIPKQEDQVLDGTALLDIVQVRKIQENGVNLVFICQVRGNG